jgi:hypothetical protein
MSINDGLVLVVVAFFGLLFYATHRDQRTSDRRQQNITPSVERRKGARRRQGLLATLTWVLRSLRPRPSK